MPQPEFIEQKCSFCFVVILCPKCQSKQFAKVIQTTPFRARIHHCTCCSYTITEKEWNEVKTSTVYENALLIFGGDAAVEKCIEKCLELALQFINYKRNDRKISQEDITAKIADAFIALEQVKLLFGEGKVKELLAMKSESLRVQIRNSKSFAYENSQA